MYAAMNETDRTTTQPASQPQPPQQEDPLRPDSQGQVAEPSVAQQVSEDDELQREINEALGDQSIEQIMSDAEAAAAQAAQGDEGSSRSSGDDSEPVELDVRRGRIASVSGDDVFVELAGLSGKNNGIVPLKQFDRTPRVGAIMDFVVERFDESEGLHILSREGAVTRSTWDQMAKGQPVEARVTGTNKGGLELELVGGIKAFMPVSHIELGHVDDTEKYIGEKLQATVEEIDRKGKRVVLSRRAYLAHQRERQRRKTMTELEVGQVREGTVASIKPFGAFVDLGGVDGMIHISDMAYSRVDKPEDVVKIGDKVTVKVLKIEQDKNRIALGLKQTAPDPWSAVEGSIHAGEDVTGRVIRTADFGAFIEVAEGVEGLLPISEMSWSRVNKTTDVVNEGDTIRVRVLQIDLKKQRISLSLKQSQGDPWVGAEHKFAVGNIVEAKVTSTPDFGAFVELEPGIEGMVHISELSNRRVGQVTDVLKIGDVEQFRILQVDEDNRKIKLSLKQVAEPAPAEAPAAPDRKKSRKQAQKHKGNLKGGMDPHGGLGMGLGDLKL